MASIIASKMIDDETGTYYSLNLGKSDLIGDIEKKVNRGG